MLLAVTRGTDRTNFSGPASTWDAVFNEEYIRLRGKRYQPTTRRSYFHGSLLRAAQLMLRMSMQRFLESGS